MQSQTGTGPDLVIAGAARSGTSTLAAQLREHPAIDPGSTKEPNYFSRHFDRGPSWYDGLFAPRAPGLLRMDASTSYTYPQFPEALDRLHTAAPQVQCVYIVREPVARTVSHYLLRRYTLQVDDAPTLGAALAASDYYTDVSDYRRWISRLTESVGLDQLLVVPFPAVTASPADVASVIWTRLGLPPAVGGSDGDGDADGDRVLAHRNAVVEFRSRGVKRATSALRRSGVYPQVRRALGANRIRRARSLLIREAVLPTVAEALASCDAAQRARLTETAAAASAAVAAHLVAQDARLGLSWASRWPT